MGGRRDGAQETGANLFRSELENLQSDEKVGREALIKKGHENGRIGRPMTLHGNLDRDELRAVSEYKKLFNRCRARYDDAISEEREKIDPRLFSNTSNEDRAEKGPAWSNLLDQLVEKKKTQLTTLGEKEKKARENLQGFINKHGLKEPAIRREQRKYTPWFLAAAVVVWTILYLLLFGNLTIEQPLVILRVWFAVTTLNLLFGWGLAELYRAFIHRANWARVTAWVSLGLLVLLALPINLGPGHYRDVLRSHDLQGNVSSVQEQPADTTETVVSASDTIGTVLPNSERETNTVDCAREYDQPSAEALCRLRHRRFSFEELESSMIPWFGLALLMFVSILWWGHDDPYLGYGRIARRHERLKLEYDLLVPRLREEYKDHIEDTYVDLKLNWEVAVRNCTSIYEAYNEVLNEIWDACCDALLFYRTANRETRPIVVKPPPHWDDPWQPSWDKITRPNFEDLCSHEEVRKIDQQEKQMLKDIDDRYDRAVEKIKRMSPPITYA